MCFLALRSGPKLSGATLPVLRPRFVTGPESCIQRGGYGPWELQLYKAVRQLGQALRGPRVAGKEAAAKEVQGGGRPEASSVLSSAPPPQDTKGPLSSLQAAGKGSVRWFLYVPWFCLQGKQTGLVCGFPLSPGLSKAQEHSQRNPENLLPALRHCCRARLLRFRWSNLRGLHFSTRRAAAKGPLKGGPSASPGPPPLVRLSLQD